MAQKNAHTNQPVRRKPEEEFFGFAVQESLRQQARSTARSWTRTARVGVALGGAALLGAPGGAEGQAAEKALPPNTTASPAPLQTHVLRRAAPRPYYGSFTTTFEGPEYARSTGRLTTRPDANLLPWLSKLAGVFEVRQFKLFLDGKEADPNQYPQVTDTHFNTYLALPPTVQKAKVEVWGLYEQRSVEVAATKQSQPVYDPPLSPELRNYLLETDIRQFAEEAKTPDNPKGLFITTMNTEVGRQTIAAKNLGYKSSRSIFDNSMNTISGVDQALKMSNGGLKVRIVDVIAGHIDIGAGTCISSSWTAAAVQRVEGSPAGVVKGFIPEGEHARLFSNDGKNSYVAEMNRDYNNPDSGINAIGEAYTSPMFVFGFGSLHADNTLIFKGKTYICTNKASPLQLCTFYPNTHLEGTRVKAPIAMDLVMRFIEKLPDAAAVSHLGN